MRKMRFAYYLLADSTPIAGLRDDVATAFPEHITVRGRFIADSAAFADLVVAGRDAFRVVAPFSVELAGPVTLANDVTWYEVLEDSVALAALRALHHRLDGELKRRRLILEDEVPLEFRGDGYRPHLTMSFKRLQPAVLAAAPQRLHVRFQEWGLFRYERWPRRPRLRCVFGEHLYGATPPVPLVTPDALPAHV